MLLPLISSASEVLILHQVTAKVKPSRLPTFFSDCNSPDPAPLSTRRPLTSTISITSFSSKVHSQNLRAKQPPPSSLLLSESAFPAPRAKQSPPSSLILSESAFPAHQKNRHQIRARARTYSPPHRASKPPTQDSKRSLYAATEASSSEP